MIYSYITTAEVHEASKQCTLEDIPDYDLRKFIEEVYNVDATFKGAFLLDSISFLDILM